MAGVELIGLRVASGLGQAELAQRIGLYRKYVAYCVRVETVDPCGRAPYTIRSGIGGNPDNFSTFTRARSNR